MLPRLRVMADVQSEVQNQSMRGSSQDDAQDEKEVFSETVKVRDSWKDMHQVLRISLPEMSSLDL